jgi:hypothetical protein
VVQQSSYVKKRRGVEGGYLANSFVIFLSFVVLSGLWNSTNFIAIILYCYYCFF